MLVRGIRGATSVKKDNTEEVLKATRELLESLCKENNIIKENIASILFTVTPDIKSVFPAKAARQMGWDMVPLLCFQEIEVAGSMPLCIRVLIHINTDKNQSEINHIYLNEAKKLRADLQ